MVCGQGGRTCVDDFQSMRAVRHCELYAEPLDFSKGLGVAEKSASILKRYLRDMEKMRKRICQSILCGE